MDGWITARVLPNIDLQEPIEGDLAALVPYQDPRLAALCKTHASLRKFLGKFKDAFGVKLYPAVLIVRDNAPKSIFTVEALAGFRDAIALSVVTRSQALALLQPRRHGINFSSSLLFYPWILDKDCKDLVVSTPGLIGFHEVAAFKGQSFPEIGVMKLTAADIDEPLLANLIQRWQLRYHSRRPQWPELALFRSLNMANQAARLPAGSDATLYDVGRSIALWVSAFEILAHPGAGKKATLTTVYNLFREVEWQYPKAERKLYKAHLIKEREIIACKLYGKIYQARNDFLHGNPISRCRLIVKPGRHSLFHYAAPLYRMALTRFLQLTCSAVISGEGAADIGRIIAKQIEFYSYQKIVEKALLTARGKEAPPYVRSRQRHRRPTHASGASESSSG